MLFGAERLTSICPSCDSAVAPSTFATKMEAEGWVLAKPVSGFHLAGCLNRGMETTGETDPVLQAVFSEVEISELGFAIAAINAWNLVNAGMRTPIAVQA